MLIIAQFDKQAAPAFKGKNHDLKKSTQYLLVAKEMSFILLSMLIILILGFFIDFVEIPLIIVPIFYPIAQSLGIDMTWFAILIAMNLQTSFLTPPFSFSLFYLKDVAPKSIQTMDIYKGVMPFLLLSKSWF